MIESISFDARKLAKNNDFSYLSDLIYFKKSKTIEFTDGVNIIFSPNGTGKSSILRMIALNLAAEQGGVSKVTTSWLLKMFGLNLGGESKQTPLHGITIKHDGQKLYKFDARQEVGLTRDRQIDQDFFHEGLVEAMEKKSTGLLTIQRTRKLADLLEDFNNIDFEITDKHRADDNEDALKILSPNIPKGKPTILMDEPESGLSPIFQGNFLTALPNYESFNKYQWIIATHSPFAFMLPDANIINLTNDKDYPQKTVNAYQILLDDLNQKGFFNNKSEKK